MVTQLVVQRVRIGNTRRVGEDSDEGGVGIERLGHVGEVSQSGWLGFSTMVDQLIADKPGRKPAVDAVTQR
jgi:hypothetical protein